MKCPKCVNGRSKCVYAVKFTVFFLVLGMWPTAQARIKFRKSIHFIAQNLGFFEIDRFPNKLFMFFLEKRHFKAISELVAIYIISFNFPFIVNFNNQVFMWKLNLFHYQMQCFTIFDIYLRFTSFKNKSNIDIKLIFVCFCLF